MKKLFCRNISLCQKQRWLISEKEKFWRLSLYDHQGLATHFHYTIDGEDIRLATEVVTLSWVTEVPSYKLWSALESGESLTSMYVRINDVFFDDEVEKSLQGIDALEDPLVRCLFDDTSFGSYQREQLKRLKRQINHL